MHQSSSRTRSRNPREAAGFFSILTFFYAINIFTRAKSRELEEEDVYEVTRNCKSHELGDKVQKEWKNEQMKKRRASLTKTLFRLFGAEYMCYGLLNLVVTTAVMVVSPLATGKLVSYFDDPTMPKWQAVSYAGAILLCGFVKGIYSQYYEYGMAQVGLKLRIALCSLIYRKSLKLTAESLAEVTNGKIVTLMSKDVEAFYTALHFTHDLWIGLLQLGVMAYLMYREIGISALVGITFLVILIPLQVWIGVKTKEMRLRTAAKTDERLRRIQEVLTSIKLIKLYNWEQYYTNIVTVLRCEEVKKLRAIFYLKSVILSISAMSYRVSFFLCIVSYALLGFMLTAEKAFVLISCYNSLYHVLSIAIPMSVSQIAEAKSALKRIKGYLQVGERSMQSDQYIASTGKVVISGAGARISKHVVLKNVNVDVCGPKLIGMTGGIGGGKSSFLRMVLQDIDICDGKVVTGGQMSYASQEPWLFPGTIQQNILFGNSYDDKRYDTVLQVCALKKDLKSFREGDMTVVNDKGLNLSKGQQARINLARAIYKICDVYLLDDVMSSLDANVSSHIFDQCIKCFLKDKLCFIVCHSEKYLQRTDYILVFEAGTIVDQGTYKDLKQKNVKFDNTLKIEGNIATKEAEGEDCAVEQFKAADPDFPLKCYDGDDNVYGEQKKRGKVELSVYKHYISFAGGWFIVSIVMLICTSSAFMSIGFDQYVRIWLDAQTEYRLVANVSSDFSDAQAITFKETNIRSLYIYCAILGVHIALVVADLFSFFTMTARASRELHIHVFARIMKAAMPFFDDHLSGGMLNRFSRDMGIIDEFLGIMYYESIRTTLALFCIMGAVVYFKPLLIAPALVFLLIVCYGRTLFMHASRSLRRLEAITKAPLVGYLNASLDGLTTIRASGNQYILEEQFDKHQDLNSSTKVMIIASERAFALWIDFLSNIFKIFVVFSFLIYSSIYEKSSDVGFVLTQVFGLSLVLQWCILHWSEVENMMTSVERLLEYADADQEDLARDEPSKWPLDGSVDYKDVKLQYAKSNNLVLQGVDFSVNGGEKVGIVGRTGAGKSSIISVLFRLYKYEGSVLVDGMDVEDVKVATLRSKISVIPQDPVMFKGTVRTNLDPYEEYTDTHLWKALDDVGLKGTVESLGGDVVEGGANWSIGQRQLFCLARAVLRRNKIVVLDEATANIDPATDAFVQAAIKRLFKNCTILTIAHRINTVINSEKIMVIDNGVVLEFDDPKVLLSRKEGAFYSVAHEAGLVE